MSMIPAEPGTVWRMAVVALVVAVNLLTLPLVIRGVGFFDLEDLAVVTTRSDTADLLELGDDEANVEATNNLFIELGQAAQGADLLVLGTTRPMDRGGRFRARLIGLMRPASVIEVDDADEALRQEVLDVAAESDHLLRQGVVWELPGRARSGVPGHHWQILLADEHPDSIVLVIVDGEDKPRWYAIDDALLSAELRGRIWPW